jgi:hypothetical protein
MAASNRSLGKSWLGRDRLPVAAGLAGPLALTAVLVPFRSSFANTDAALALLLLVVAVAAAVWFDFFLTRPYETFSIARATDIETTVLLLVIGVAVTEIAVWGWRQHSTSSRRSGYLAGINDAAQAAAVGESPSALISRVSDTLVQLLSLRSCQFQYGMAGLGGPGRIQPDGEVLLGRRMWDVEADGLPTATGTELLVESGGRLQGRFLMQPDPAARPSREQLLVAVGFANQVGAALATSHPVGG